MLQAGRKPMALAVQQGSKAVIALLRTFGPKPSAAVNSDLCAASKAGRSRNNTLFTCTPVINLSGC